MKKALVVFGTRPELVKMAPVVRALESSKLLKAHTCATAQHRGLLDQMLDFFEITPDFDLDLMQENQDLFSVSTKGLNKIRKVLEELKPDVVLVQGDTTTAFIAALASFYLKIPVGHVEAGLRTAEKYSPFPEEINRRLITPLADYHFAPTSRSVKNLLAENISPRSIFQVGNTGVEALHWVSGFKKTGTPLEKLYEGKPMVLLTAHRRESFGKPLLEIFSAIRDFADQKPNFQIIYPVHPNPNVREMANQVLKNSLNIHLCAPVAYGEMVQLLKDCQFVMTDSGGIQEEAPTFGKPVLVLRESTERQEAIEANCARLVGHDYGTILNQMTELSDLKSSLYQSMAKPRCPFGEGKSAKKIVSILEKNLIAESPASPVLEEPSTKMKRTASST